MKILFLVPPTLQFEDLIDPPKNVGTIEKFGQQFGLVLTDLPIGIISLSAYL
jgi:anaerobic magnesium-protoporphyrin IX monomethyl ester cyclase